MKKASHFRNKKIRWSSVLILLFLCIPLVLFIFYISGRQMAPSLPSKADDPNTTLFNWNSGFDRMVSSESVGLNNRRFHTVTKDSVITNVKIKLSNMSPNLNADVCLFKDRSNNPIANYPLLIGGFSETLCVYADQASTVSPEWNLDFSDTPISIPEGTRLNCDSIVYGSSIPAMPQLQCEVTLKTYSPETPRYKVFRIPYIDALVFQPGTQQSLETSYYMSSEKFPLKIRKVLLFNSFIGVNNGKNNNTIVGTVPCIKWMKQGGVIKEERCFPYQELSRGGNYRSPDPIDLNWNLTLSDLVTASCVSENFHDCAFYVFAQIPSSIPISPYEVFNDFGNVPASALATYCKNVTPFIDQTLFCGGGPDCTNEKRKLGCQQLFPQAELPLNNAQFVSQNIPSRVKAGTQFDVSLKFKNTGKIPWSSKYWYRLGDSFDLSPALLSWTVKRAEIQPAGRTIFQGGTATFTFKVKAPSKPGTYAFSWQMVQDSVEWFGQKSPPINIVVTQN